MTSSWDRSIHRAIILKAVGFASKTLKHGHLNNLLCDGNNHRQRHARSMLGGHAPTSLNSWIWAWLNRANTLDVALWARLGSLFSPPPPSSAGASSAAFSFFLDFFSFFLSCRRSRKGQWPHTRTPSLTSFNSWISAVLNTENTLVVERRAAIRGWSSAPPPEVEPEVELPRLVSRLEPGSAESDLRLRTRWLA